MRRAIERAEQGDLHERQAQFCRALPRARLFLTGVSPGSGQKRYLLHVGQAVRLSRGWRWRNGAIRCGCHPCKVSGCPSSVPHRRWVGAPQWAAAPKWAGGSLMVSRVKLRVPTWLKNATLSPGRQHPNLGHQPKELKGRLLTGQESKPAQVLGPVASPKEGATTPMCLAQKKSAPSPKKK